MNRPFPKAALGAALLAAFAAQAADVELEPVVVTATRTPVSQSHATADISVITRRDLDQAGQSSLIDLLRAQPGVEVSQSGGPGQPASIFLRGGSAGHTVVLIDGVRQSNLNFGTASPQALPLALIERIEILRGPASGLYGADAIGGVIQIFTRQAGAGTHFSAVAGGATDQRYLGMVDAGTGNDLLSVRFTAGQEGGRSDVLLPSSYAHHPDKDLNRKDYRAADLRLTPAPGHDLRLNLFETVSTAEFDTEYPFPPYASSAPKARSVRTVTNTNLSSSNRLLGNWLSTLRLGRSEESSRFLHTNSFDETVSTRNDLVAWQNDIALPLGELTLGAEQLEQRLGATATQYGKTARTARSFFGGYGFGHGQHRFRANARSDDTTGIGRHNTGDLAYGYEFLPHWVLTGRVGRAFKAPTLNDLYYIDPYASFLPNPALQPETSRNREATLAYASGTGRFSATLFENRIAGLITNFDPDGYNSPLPGTVINAGKARIRGLGLEARQRVGDWLFQANATFQDPKNLDSGDQLARRARQSGSLLAERQLGAWKLGMQWQGQGARYDSQPNAASNRMAGYGLLHLYADYRLDREWSIRARWNNVFDKDYELAKGYAHERANLFVSLNYNYGS